jgi:hypothetical protein
MSASRPKKTKIIPPKVIVAPTAYPRPTAKVVTPVKSSIRRDVNGSGLGKALSGRSEPRVQITAKPPTSLDKGKGKRTTYR